MRTILTSLITAMATAALVGYLSIVLSVEDLTIFYRLINSTEIGTRKLVVTFSISNMGRQGALIEELGLLQVVGDEIKDDVCNDEDVLSNLSYRQPREQLRLKTGNLMSYNLPSEIFVDNVRAISGSVALNAGTAKKLDTTFEIAPFDLSKNSASLCPVVKYFDRSGRTILSVCPGWTREPIGNNDANFTQGIGSRSLRLLPPQRSFLNTLFWRYQDIFCASTT